MRVVFQILAVALLGILSGGLRADEGNWLRERLPLQALAPVLADSYDAQIPLLSADMLLMAEASQAWIHEAARTRTRDLAHRELVRLTRDALLERWRTWKLDDPDLTGALVNLLVDYVVLWRFHEPQDEFLLTFEKSLQIRLSSFYRGHAGRPPISPDAPPEYLMRRYAREQAPDLNTPAGRKKALLWVHLLRTDPALARVWEAARDEEESHWPGSDAAYRRVLEAAADLPLGRMSDLVRVKADRAFAAALASAPPITLPLLPQAGRDDGAFLRALHDALPPEQGLWLRALGELGPQTADQPGLDPARRIATHSPVLALARWLMSAPERLPADKSGPLPLAEDWRVECRPELYRTLNRWHHEAAQEAEARPRTESRAAHHRRWQMIFGLLQSCTPEPAHAALDFMRLPPVLAAAEGPLMPALALLETPARRLEGMGATAPTLRPLWWLQSIRAELPHEPELMEFQGLADDDGFLPPLVPLPPEADFDRAPAPRRVSLVTLRLSIGRVLSPETRPGAEEELLPLGPRPLPHLSLPE